MKRIPKLFTLANHRRARGFNLIELMLAMVFFALAFSAMMVGTQSIIAANVMAGDLHAENSAIYEVLNQIDFHALDVEARYDINGTRQQIVISDKDSPSDAKRLYYQLNVYSEPQYPDVKIADLILYKRPTDPTVYRRYQRRISLLSDCYNFGGTSLLKYNDLVCAAVPVANNAGEYSTVQNISLVNRALSSDTAYTGIGFGSNMPSQQTNLALHNPENDNVWGGIITPTAIDVGNMFDYDPTLATTATLGTNDNVLLNTGMVFDRTDVEAGTNGNVTLLMPASSDTINTNIANSSFRYDLEIGVFMPVAGERIRVIPRASNVSEVTGGVGHLDFTASTANEHLTVRLEDVQPFHDDYTDRPHVGATLLITDSAGTTLNVRDVIVTYMVKRPLSAS